MKHLSLTQIIAALLISNVFLLSCGVSGTVEKTAPAQQPQQETDQRPEDELHGQGTVDFIAPDAQQQQTVYIEQLTFAQPPLSERPVSSTFMERGDIEPQEQTFESVELIDTEETAPESEESELIVVPEESAEPEPPATTPAATTATTPPETEPAPVTTTSATSTTPATTTTPATSATTTTPATTTTTAATTPESESSSAAGGGIKVEDTTSSTTAPRQPEEIPTDVADEILYVNNGGVTVSGSALDIVSRVTQNEVGYTFAPEAIKAQAVAAYTYIKYCNKYGSYPSVILSDSVNDSVRTLTASVIGQAVYCDGSLIQAVYSASSAGSTASSESVWGNYYSYLTSVYCELDEQYDPNYGRTATFSADDMKSRIYNKTGISLTGSPAEWFTIDKRVDGKYVEQMSIGGYHSYIDSDGDTVKISGRVFRQRIMGYDIRSSAFDISYDEATDSFTITTYGYGHGVGLSQNGANALATYWGWDYKQILEFYYTGTEVY